MSPQRHEQIKKLFLASCELEPPARSAFLEQACAGDPELQAEVESLLAFHHPATILEEVTADVPVQESASSPGAASDAQARFLPGTIIADRYRIVNLLGRGGMGEVYRADDLKLQRAVALKFIAPGRVHDAVWLARFFNEARLALSITHPNVCRVYDLGEANGEAFISMEYVDGEDLGCLLRRIGRLSVDKAMEIGWQLCAALASAHAQGVLHRDLKPANVMIDGRGRVRVTDFGISTLAVTAADGHPIVGTPAYMAPETLAGKPATLRTDLYALGLVLYEMVTGRPAFQGGLAEQGRRTRPEPPSHLNGDLDPRVEQVILQCIEEDPADRPSSAYAVMAVLPGGDALAAVLEAGETPPPEMVAAAGSRRRLSIRALTILGAVTLVGLAVSILLVDRTMLLSGKHLPVSPHVLEEKARQIARGLGAPVAGRDARSGFFLDRQALRRHGIMGGGAITEDKTVQPLRGTIWFECRWPVGLFSSTQGAGSSEGSTATRPAHGTAVRLDPGGRLLLYSSEGVLASGEAGSKEPDWSIPAGWAGLEPRSLQSIPPWIAPPLYADTLHAGKGVLKDEPQSVVQIEGAALGGRIVYYTVADAGSSALPKTYSGGDASFSRTLLIVLQLIALAGGCVLAWRNLQIGRGDRRGARRLAVFMLLLSLAFRVVGHDWTLDLTAEAQQALRAVEAAAFTAVVTWILYLGLEPYVRRFWPQSIISWSRLLQGRLTDPLVGRDLVVGVAIATGVLLLQQLQVLLSAQIIHTPPLTLLPDTDNALGQLLGLRHTLTASMRALGTVVGRGIVLLVLMLLIRLAVKIPWLSAVLFFFLVTVAYALTGESAGLSTWILSAIVAGGATIVLVRAGFLALVVSSFVVRFMLSNPLTPDPYSWCAGETAFTVGLVLALLAFGIYASAVRDRSAPRVA
ncbi:MAG TPA: serine/threonine-protein kinase [Phycisphaerae bacterium]|jgi:predicted Ser/Thr protein kinase|nr:serine/threonine protein kinase [Phycisphaerae bacterium]HOB76128.1 serine/threonine-protein kinase [Phycisphaerae bacterium]HOJ56013.1 serine/threonine-protein kinase [Phycisphaerae bacterium]HOL25534.1 serine/threonine-protein kinase [Phycisphaerae bacterium]HPP22273.1 serine/threonine-protein kinase [Phycisphaerae bacterium]